jgi:phospholipid N-methyltransferase
MIAVLFLGFDGAEIKKWLEKPETVGVVIFDNSYKNRDNFENLYKQHTATSNKHKQLTMYEGCVTQDLEAYLHKQDGNNYDCIFSGDLTLLNSCKNDKQNEIHDSCL